MSASKPRASQRIAKLLARAGIASRRDIERMIVEGRIALNGAVLDTPATLLTSLRGVTVDGKPVAEPAPARLFAFHKPVGLLTAARDPQGRATIYDKLPKDLPRVVPVGRLDRNTEGLLLLTTDGGLKRTLELPATGIERSYRARAFGTVSQAQLEDLIEGIEIDGVRYGSIDANLERRTGANVWIELTLTEGKNREVRRVLEHLGLKVSRLIRTRYGPFHLADLPEGEVAEVRQHDLVAFRKALAGPGGGKAASNLQFTARARTAPAPVAATGPAPANRAQRRAASAQVAAPEAKPARPRRTGTAKGESGPAPRTAPKARAKAEGGTAKQARTRLTPRGETADAATQTPRAARPPRKPGARIRPDTGGDARPGAATPRGPRRPGGRPPRGGGKGPARG